MLYTANLQFKLRSMKAAHERGHRVSWLLLFISCTEQYYLRNERSYAMTMKRRTKFRTKFEKLSASHSIQQLDFYHESTSCEQTISPSDKKKKGAQQKNSKYNSYSCQNTNLCFFWFFCVYTLFSILGVNTFLAFFLAWREWHSDGLIGAVTR